jgi:hypothetical protein
MLKKLQIILLLFSCISIKLDAQTIPNGSFENWATGNAFNPNTPLGWIPNAFTAGAIKSTDPHTGTFALKCAVVNFFTATAGADVSTGFAIPTLNSAPKYFTFWAKVHLSGNDELIVDADIFNHSTTRLITRIPYGEGVISSSKNSKVWTQFSFALQTDSPAPCDTVRLRFYMQPSTDTSSYVIVDDLAFSDFPSGIDESKQIFTLNSIFPNPANTTQSVDYVIAEDGNVNIDIYTIMGNKVKSILNEKQQIGTYKVDMEVSNLSDGTYILRLSRNGIIASKLIAIKH